MLEDADQNQSDWIIPNGSNLSRTYDKAIGSNVVNYLTYGQYDSAITLQLDHVLDLVLSIDISLKPNSSFMVQLQIRETEKVYNIHYIVGDVLLSFQDENIYYGIGSSTENNVKWKHLTRDLLVDLQKGIQLANSIVNTGAGSLSSANDKPKRKYRRPEIKVTAILFLGNGSFDNLTLSTSEHIAQFYDSAEWFVRHQDVKTGGWPNPVRRKLSEFIELKQGWYSAMGQGHAISLLARAFHHSNGDIKYLKAAINALKPFSVPSRQGGVLAKFLGKYDW